GVRSLPMAKSWNFRKVRVRVVAKLTAPGHHRTTAGALAAVLLLALLLGAATVPLDARLAYIVAPPRGTVVSRSDTTQPARSGVSADPSIDILAVIVARKYRVSQEAT